MNALLILYNGEVAGKLTKESSLYRFIYDRTYLNSSSAKPVSLTMPLREAAFESPALFPYFVNRLSEGSNKAIQNRLLKIDEDDYFGLLIATSGKDSIGPVTLQKIDESS